MSSKKTKKGIPFSKVRVGGYFSPVSRQEVICQKIEYRTQGEGCCKMAINLVIKKHPKKDAVNLAECMLPEVMVIERKKPKNVKDSK